jgi:phosphoribosylamine---glycine ligase
VKVLVVGSGGREHALAWKLAQSQRLTELHAAPGNPGIAGFGQCHPVRPEDPEGLLALAHSLELDLVVIGPEGPLVSGVADALRLGGVPVFGPSAAAARIEGSKRFAREVLEAAGVRTADAVAVARPPCVVKADGLAAGKGVFVCRSQEELDEALRAVSAIGEDFVVEELLVGEEVSLFAISDGSRALPLPPAQDFKRAFDGDAGPNTGGMGAYSPVPIPELDAQELVEQIHEPVLSELARRDAPFVGLLYAGLMLTSDGPRVLEFNCRFGDPETQAIVPRLDGDFLGALAGAAAGDLGSTSLGAAEEAAVTIVLAAADYPPGSDSGSPIEGVEAAEEAGALVFHAGTALRDGRLVTNGGRVLDVTCVGGSIAEARDRAYAAAELISFPGARFRRDIAAAAAEREARVGG